MDKSRILSPAIPNDFKKALNLMESEDFDTLMDYVKWKENEIVKEIFKEILDLISEFNVDGGHHKQWVIDQIVRKITGDKYNEWVKSYKDGEDGAETFDWNEGIAP